ncbi:hypothetical protein GOP47_0005161 [Adiantum capillus-veneris]|uniref:RRM domain-containing protein n=1 Tax=Adiantum capillus-veneris TaxID=13818 RepID=A0A9D4V5C3_ADICA|nr:hypothetical protein GOP47_0005161 [Adiantum capillus-veneris]
MEGAPTTPHILSNASSRTVVCDLCVQLPSSSLCVLAREVSNPVPIMSRNPSCTIYVGNLPGDVREEEIEDLFHKYGRIVDIELKLPPRPPGFCFVEFEDARDAEDAIEGRNGYKYDGNYLRVELAHGGRGPPPSDRHSSHSSGRGAPIPRRAEFRVYVSKLPQTASWQDLKDHMRKAGDVSFAQVFREGGGTVGIVDYTNYEDMKYAIRKLDDSEFRNRYSRAFIRVGFQLIARKDGVIVALARAHPVGDTCNKASYGSGSKLIFILHQFVSSIIGLS